MDGYFSSWFLQNPPNFLRASALSEHISPVVVIPAESSSPESEHVVETDDLVDTDIPVLPVSFLAGWGWSGEKPCL